MRKVFAAAALCAVAIVPVAAANGAATKAPHRINAKVNVFATPKNEVVPPSSKESTTSVTVTGKLKSQATCRAHRKIEFIYVTPAGAYLLSERAVTGSNGSFTATLPTPTGAYKKPNTVTVQASTDRISRRDKKSGEKVICLDNQIPALSDFTQV